MKRLIPLVAIILVGTVWYLSQRTPVQAVIPQAAIEHAKAMKRLKSEPLPLAAGVNLAPVHSWSTAWTFVDLFKTSRPWVGQISGQAEPFDTGKAVKTDENGWPILVGNEAVGTLMMHGMDGHYPGGRYICRYQGEGEIHFGMDAEIIRQGPGVIELFVRPRHGIYLRIDRSNPSDPVRNISIKTPEFDVSRHVFHPRFLKSLEGFTILRFMDWNRTNNSEISSWDQRTPPDDPMQTLESGVAYEYMIQLCNQLNANPWLCIPAQADDAYVMSLAHLIQSQLKPELTVYVEYSNEIWNRLFKQSRYCEQQGLRMRLSTKPKIARLRYQSQRSVEIARQFKHLLGEDRKVIHVLSSQTVSSESSRELLSWKAAYQHVDALGVGAYFAHETGAKFLDSKLSGNRLVDEMLTHATRSIKTLEEHLQAQQDVAEHFGVTLTAYEAGQHMTLPGRVPRDHQMHEVIAQINRGPRMGTLYSQLFAAWKQTQGGPLVGFNHISKPKHSGAWGLLAYQDDHVALSPKMQAFQSFARQLQRNSLSELLADSPDK